MESLIPTVRLVHFFSLSLYLGGLLASMLANGSQFIDMPEKYKFIKKLLHLLCAPGLTLLWLTGLFQAFIYKFSHFRDAGYMHVKTTLALLLLILLFAHIKAIKRYKGFLHNIYSVLQIITIFIIMFLISFRPF